METWKGKKEKERKKPEMLSHKAQNQSDSNFNYFSACIQAQWFNPTAPPRWPSG